jgi:glycosyltransferase involved in cell wall biosynthesis
MKILFFIDGLQAGGKERRLVELIKSISKESGIDFQLVVMNKEIHYKEILQLNLKIHYLIRKSKKEISIFNKLYMTAIYAVPVCKILGIKLVNGLVVDAPAKRNIFNKYWLRARLTFPFSNVIIGNSLSGLKAYNAPVKKSVHIYNGFNFDRIKNLLDAEQIRKELSINNGYIIGMVASFSLYKDYKTYLSAAELLLQKRKDITFLAIGNHTDSAAAKELISGSNTSNFRMLGKKIGVESYINAMDICVLATFTEGISNSILEYMSLGKPVIATSGGGTDEIVINNKTGFLIPMSNPQELANRIEQLLSDHELCQQFGLNGKQRIEETFSIHSMTEKFVACYRTTMSKVA